MVKNERDVLIKANIAKIRKDLLVIDGALKSLDLEWSEDFYESKVTVAQLRKLYVENIRLLDSIGSSIFYEEKINSIGFRPLTLGNGRDRDVTKSDSDSLVNRILRGVSNVKDITRETKPKARNE